MATAEEEFKERTVAPESLKTKRAREKLIKKWEKEKEWITPKALKETIDKIHKWIGDNAKNRTRIKSTSIALFKPNTAAAASSKKIETFVEKLKKDMEYFRS